MCNTCHDLLATSYVLAEAGSSIYRRLGDEPAIREFVEQVHQSATVGLRLVLEFASCHAGHLPPKLLRDANGMLEKISNGWGRGGR